MLKLCILGPSLWPNIELGVTVGFPSPPKALLPTAVRPLNDAGRLKGSK